MAEKKVLSYKKSKRHIEIKKGEILRVKTRGDTIIMRLIRPKRVRLARMLQEIIKEIEEELWL